MHARSASLLDMIFFAASSIFGKVVRLWVNDAPCILFVISRIYLWAAFAFYIQCVESAVSVDL